MQDILIIVDLQKGVCLQTMAPNWIISIRCCCLPTSGFQTYRHAQRPVLFVQHEEEELGYQTDEWLLHPDLAVQATDLFCARHQCE